MTDSQADLDGSQTAQCEVQVVAACDDGDDNDGDGLFDWDGAGVSGPDPGCDNNPEKESEVNVNPQCSDGDNNDPSEDSLIDIADPGCHTDEDPTNDESYDPDDDDERDPVLAECSDGVDNDNDGKVDYQENESERDPGCTSPDDNNESDPSIEEF